MQQSATACWHSTTTRILGQPESVHSLKTFFCQSTQCAMGFCAADCHHFPNNNFWTISGTISGTILETVSGTILDTLSGTILGILLWTLFCKILGKILWTLFQEQFCGQFRKQFCGQFCNYFLSIHPMCNGVLRRRVPPLAEHPAATRWR